MYYRYTEKAERAIRLAEQAATELGHNYIGTEHILLGLIREGTGVAARVLENNGIAEDKVLDEIEDLVGIGTNVNQAPVGATPRTKRVLEMSSREASKLGHGYIGTEHILLAVLRESDSVAVRVIINIGVEPEKIFTELVRLFNEDNGTINVENATTNKKSGDN